jgi:hypothetical protein
MALDSDRVLPDPRDPNDAGARRIRTLCSLFGLEHLYAPTVQVQDYD